MATTTEIQAQLDENNTQRVALAAKLGPMTDAAQQAYDTAQFFKPREGQTYSPSWTGSLNGQTFTDPSALYAAAQSDFEVKADLRKQTAVEFNALFTVKASLEEQLKTAEDPTTTVKSPEATNPSATDAASADKQANAEVVGDTSVPANDSLSNGESIVDALGTRSVPGVPAGAEPAATVAAEPTVKGIGGEIKSKDLRVKIRVPHSYLTSVTSGSAKELSSLGAIIFPYTPTISYEHKADYASANPMHSNFAINFYQRSSISNISISGKFTVQNEKDAAVYLATVHLLRALTKMKSGGEVMSGSPPPVCRLDAYGDYMMANVPVSISSFRVELPDGVDYFTLGQKTSGPYGLASVPIVSTIAITCVPMYSRAEMQKFTVSGWLSDASVRKSGIL
jgi:hypothetical protein